MPVIDTNGLRVVYSDVGDGPPVVFVPGLAGSGDWFRYQTSGLSDRFRVITYDLRPARADYSLDILVEDLARIITARRAYSAAVVGYSFGGLVALKYALDYPDRCPALVLCSTSPAFPAISEAEMISQLLPPGIRMQGFWERILGLFRRRQADMPRDEAEAFLSRVISGLDTATLQARLKLMRSTDLSSQLPGVDVPTLITASFEDPPFVLSGSQTLYEQIPDSVLEVTEGTDRFYFYTRHDVFNGILADYLSEAISRF